MNKFSIKSLALIAALAVTFSGTLFAQDDEPESSWLCIPNNAFAFVYVDLTGLSDSPTLRIPMDMVGGIEKELNEVFQNKIGIRPTELFDATIVIPTFENAMASIGSETAPGVLVVSFSSPVSMQRIAAGLGANWTQVDVDGRFALVNGVEDKAIFHQSENALVLGTADQVQWFIDNESNDEYTGLSLAMAESEYGQIIVGVDGSQIPDEAVQFLPAEMRVLSKLQFATISLDLLDGIFVNNVFEFDTVEDAKSVSGLANSQLQVARDSLAALETDSLRVLSNNNDSIEASIEPLATLAACRYGQKLLNKAEVQQFRNRVLSHVGIEGIDGTMLLGIVPAVVASMGNSAEASFQEVASELEVKIGSNP